MTAIGLIFASLALIASSACVILLFRGYKSSRERLLFWSALCFVFLTLNNVFLVIDLAIVDIDFRPYRLGAGLVGMICLLFGFIWEAE